MHQKECNGNGQCKITKNNLYIPANSYMCNIRANCQNLSLSIQAFMMWFYVTHSPFSRGYIQAFIQHIFNKLVMRQSNTNIYCTYLYSPTRHRIISIINLLFTLVNKYFFGLKLKVKSGRRSIFPKYTYIKS